MKFHKRQFKLTRQKYKYLFLVFFAISGNIFPFDEANFLNYKNGVQNCSYPQYPLLIYKDESDVLNAGKMNIKSNGELYLYDDVFIGLKEGKIIADSATFIQKQNSVKDIKNGSIYHSNNYFNFLTGSLEKQSGRLQLDNGTTFLSERNLLISYESLDGNLGEDLNFKNAALTSCNNNSQGWEIEAASINIDEGKSRGLIKDMKLKILNKKILTLPYLPFPATTKRLSGFLEPELNLTSDGLDLFLPYFWVLSNQSDITIAPRILNDRGSGIEANYRYLTNAKSENFVDLIFFPKDKKFRKDFAKNKDQRWAFRFKENRQLSNFKTYIDWSKSSDSMVLLDLPSSITNIANQRDHYLNQTFSMNFLSKNLSFSFSREGYQSLNPFINNGYIKSPGIHIEYLNNSSKISYFTKLEYATFDIDKGTNRFFSNNSISETGKRSIAEIGAEIFYNFKYFDIAINGSTLHKKYNLDKKYSRSTLSSIPSVKINISSLLKKSSVSGISLIIPEFVYQKTDYKDQSLNPIFDLHQRNSGNLNALKNDYFFGKDRIPDSEFLAAKLSWQKKMHDNQRFAVQLIKKNELETSRVINAMLSSPLGKDSQIGTKLSFRNNGLKTYIAANYSQKRNSLNYGETGLEISSPDMSMKISRNFQRNIPLLDLKNELDYAEFSLERLMPQGYKIIGGISKDLVSKKKLETYFGFGFENCCLAFKIYASDKRLSKYNFLNIQQQEFNQMYWEKMISIENKSRINFEFELKGLTGANKRINRFFSNALQDL